MDAIGLNPIKLDAIGLDPIRMNAIRLGVPGASSDSARPYIDPELLSHVKMAISTWGKTNDDPDRTVLKDLSGNGNDMRLLNFGFAEGSGYGLYGTDFNNWRLEMSTITGNQVVTFNRGDYKSGVFFLKIPTSSKVNIASFTVDVDFKSSKEDAAPYYYYWDTTGKRNQIRLVKGKNVLPANYASNSTEGTTGSGFHDNFCDTVTIKQILDFAGWLCTDGVDDIIESVKPISEMLEGSNEITVVSIIHQIGFRGISSVPLTNYIRLSDAYIRNNVSDINKTGIYGYTCSNIKKSSSINTSVVNNILGDKNDYSVLSTADVSTAKFSVQGYIDASGKINELSQVAYAGGFIANKVLTTDEINQIIAYYNLDRPGQIIKPQLYCNIKKQGITNDNHAEFNDQLIDFVGGHNIQLNNIGWEGESGINSYPVVFGANKTWINLRTNDNIKWSYELTSNRITIYKVERSTFPLFYSYIYNEGIVSNITISPFNIKVSGLKTGESIRYYYVSTDNTAIRSYINITANGVHKLPASVSIQITEESPSSIWVGMTMTLINNENIEGVTIEILPTIENALCLDGISDFGKATGLPVLKDYTVVAEREIPNNNPESFGLISDREIKNNIELNTFVFEKNRVPYAISFGMSTSVNRDDSLKISYQSKYSYNGESIVVGDTTGNNILLLGVGLINNDIIKEYVKAAVRFLMLFPYSLSEFLLERQLRKYKAGTLYPDMIEFRPIVKSNVPYSSISYSVNPGVYVTEGSTVTITITLSNASDKLVGVSSNAISDISISGDNGTYEITGKVTKSPQKISIAIDEYIRYEDIIQPYPFVVPIYDENDNLISWGDKLRVGSTIRYQRVYNLIPELYLADIIYYNGNVIDGTGGTLIAEKEMVFSNRKTWLLSTAEPLFIYDPSMINNVGLQNLGYLPDLTGQRRHLKLNNMAYDEESGIGADGALHYDGVDDHGIVQSLSHGGQCLIMKANWNVVEQMMFDQRFPVNTVNTFSIYLSSLDKDNNTVPAYQSRNDGGETYIDNVLNKYVGVRDLMGKTHVITATNGNSDDSNTVSPKFGCSNVISMFCQFAMFRTMLLPAIPSSEDRTTINNWCGIEGDYVEKPEYYWDAHGKTNTDPDKNTIKNRGTEQSLISNSSPTNLQTDWIANEFTFVNSASDVDIMSGDRLASTAYEARFLTGQVIPAMQVTLTLVNSAYDTFSYMYVDEEGSSQRIYFNDLVLNEPVTVDLPKNNNNNTNTGFILEANNSNAVINVKVLSQSVNIENAFDLEANNLAYTDESGYKENGLYLDGVEDYLVNPNVPALTDYTYIIKFKDFDNPVYNSCIQHKGPYKAGGSAFIQDYVDTSGLKYQYSFGSSNNVRNNDTVIYCTKKNYNGNPIGSGTNSDGLGITTGKWASYRKMIFYKEMLFSRTIDMLSINMLRNLFELDEIIDLNNKLFKK